MINVVSSIGKLRNIAKTILLFVFIITFSSCNNKKEMLIEEFKKIYQLVEQGKMDSLFLKLDDNSRSYVEFVTDTANLEYDKLKTYGESKNLKLFTCVYYYEFGKRLTGSSEAKISFMSYLGLSHVPLFGWLAQPKLLEDQTVTGSENYVIVGTKVNETTYITSKVKFTLDEHGKYRIDLLELLKFNEKILTQQFQNYKKMYGLKKVEGTKQTYIQSEEEKPEDMLKDFLENMDEEENQITILKYNPKIKKN